MPLRLLLVEFDRALLHVYCAYFARIGLETTPATDGIRGRDHYLSGRIDSVLLEPDLPNHSSDVLLDAMARRTPRRPLPVVVLSRRANLRLSQPVHVYLVKPVSMSTLLQSIYAAAGNTADEGRSR